MYVYVCVCICVCIYVYLYICVYVCIYTHRKIQKTPTLKLETAYGGAYLIFIPNVKLRHAAVDRDGWRKRIEETKA